ncbi:MAG: NUDIX hydrolase [Thermodesulfovibrionales bacterium]
MGAYEVLNRETLWEGKFLRAVSLRYKDSSGKLRDWEAVERVNCKGIVAVVPITNDGCVLLIRQFRPPVNGYVIEFPAGLNDRDEDLDVVAKRELLEETGYQAKEITFLGRGPLSSGSSVEVLTVYLAKGLEFVGVSERDETEEIEVIKVPLNSVEDRLKELEDRGNLIDLKILGFIAKAVKTLS